MPAQSNNGDDVEQGELSARSPASKVLLFLLVKQMPASEGIMCHRASWLRQPIVSSNSLAFRFAVQRVYRECCHPTPCAAICPHLDVPLPEQVAPRTRCTLSSHHQVLPSHAGAPLKPRRCLQQEQEIPPGNKELKSARQLNSSLPEPPVPAAGC